MSYIKTLLHEDNLISNIEYITILRCLIFDNHEMELRLNEIHFKRKNQKFYISKFSDEWSLSIVEKDEHGLPLYRQLKKLGTKYTRVAQKVNNYLEEIS
mgnify:CR=1 FL=1